MLATQTIVSDLINLTPVCGSMATTEQHQFLPNVVKEAQRVFDTYAEFVAKLADVYPEHQTLNNAVVQNGGLMALPDGPRVAHVVRLAMRWTRMVAAAPLAFEQHNNAILTTNSVQSVLCELGVNELVSGSDAKRQTFKLIQTSFWAYVDVLTKLCKSLLAIAPEISEPNLEAAARLNNQLSQMDLPMVHDQYGNVGVNLAQVCAPNDIKKTAAVLENAMRKGNVHEGAIKAVVSMLHTAGSTGADGIAPAIAAAAAAASATTAATTTPTKGAGALRQRMRAKLDAKDAQQKQQPPQ